MTWILTRSGKHFDFADPKPQSIITIDIAYGLANECRYAGQCSKFYSVAQHSVLASLWVEPEHAFEALMHDAAEAYCKDIPRPLKAMLPQYRRIEERVDLAIRVRYGLPLKCSPAVKHIDLVLLATERRDLMPADEIMWTLLDGIDPRASVIEPWSPDEARRRFWHRFAELMLLRPECPGDL